MDSLDELLKKHPKSQPAHSAALQSDGCNDQFHPVIFEGLDLYCCSSYLWCSWALRIGCLQLETPLYLFQGASDDLCCSLALVVRRLCTSCVDPDGLVALVACHLIALNKNPGIRPIGVGEMVRWIIAKAEVVLLVDASNAFNIFNQQVSFLIFRLSVPLLLRFNFLSTSIERRFPCSLMGVISFPWRGVIPLRW